MEIRAASASAKLRKREKNFENHWSRRTTIYPLDAVHDKNRLHKRAAHASAQSSQKALFYGSCSLNAWTWIPVQTILYELET